jgi:hypothetical protein
MKPLPNRNPEGDSRLAQVRYWQNIGGYGISPEMLALTGFWPDMTLEKMKDSNMNPSQAIQQIYGGILRFQPLPGKKWEGRFDQIIDALNTILQMRRQIDHALTSVKMIMKQKWHDNDMDYIPEDLDPEKINAIMRKSSYLISENTFIARQIMSLVPILEGMKSNPQYWSGIYREANTIFGRMVLEGVSLSLSNLSMKDNGPRTITLEELADHAAEAIMEGE